MDFKLICGLVIGAALMWLVFALVNRWKARKAIRHGIRGEKMVARELHRLKSPDAIVLNNLLLDVGAGKTTQIDHLVISIRGVFVIETKSFVGRITGSEHSQYWTQHLQSQSRQFYNPLLQNRGHIRVLRKILPNLDDDAFVSIIVFTEARQLDIKADDIVIPRSILPDKHIRRTFIPAERVKRRWWTSEKEVRLDENSIVTNIDDFIEEIQRRERILPKESLPEILAAIEKKVLRGRSYENAHVAYAKENSRRISSTIQAGICPRCGGDLIRRKGKNGEFVGCSNFPECRFVCSIDHML